MVSRSEKMYGNSPEMGKDEDGKPTVKRREKKAAEVSAGTDGEQGADGVPMTARHAMERHGMNGRHEMEHSVHDHSKAGSKKEMHERHEKEMKDMHARHEKEMAKGEKTGGEKIEKIESDKKE